MAEDLLQNNARALVFLAAWYATPDDQPPGYWEAFVRETEAHRICFGVMDEEEKE